MRLVVGWQGGCVTGQGGCASGGGGVRVYHGLRQSQFTAGAGG